MKDKLEACSTLFNRRKEQVHYLYNLFNGDLYRYMEFELVCKKKFIYRCPNTYKEAIKMMYGTQE